MPKTISTQNMETMKNKKYRIVKIDGLYYIQKYGGLFIKKWRSIQCWVGLDTAERELSKILGTYKENIEIIKEYGNP